MVTLLLAIGGYVINDYFDVKIDSVNRPDKMVVNKNITPRNAIKIHIILNVIAILLGFYLAFRIRSFSFGFIFPFISGLLWIYSAKYKRVLFWGNFIVSILSAFVILVLWLYEFFYLHLHPEVFAVVLPHMGWVSRIILGYALFAFLTTMIREVIKDMEDYEGDKKYECKTIPVVSGIRVARYIVVVMIAGTMILLGWAQLILYRLDMRMAFWYFTFAVQIPTSYLLVKILTAKEQQDFHFLSSISKLIMVAGILSMEILLISN
jgi:4-hydroxybenzoate polyprenyltransferase